MPQTPPFYCPKSEGKARGKMFLTMQFLRRHYIGSKHGILQRYIRDELAEMRARDEQPYDDTWDIELGQSSLKNVKKDDPY